MIYIVITKDSTFWGSYKDPQTLRLLPGIIKISTCQHCAEEYLTPQRALLAYDLDTNQISELTT